MKKVSIIAIISLCLTLTSCGGEDKGEDTEVKAVTTGVTTTTTATTLFEPNYDVSPEEDIIESTTKPLVIVSAEPAESAEEGYFTAHIEDSNFMLDDSMDESLPDDFEETAVTE